MSDIDLPMPGDEIDGYTVEELGDYLDRDRTPTDPGIESSAACRLALAGMQRARELSFAAMTRRADEEPERDSAWISSLLDTIRTEVRSGRDIPVSHPDPTLRLSLTEAAVRGLIRRTGDTMGGIIVGSSSLEGDVGIPGAPVTVRMTIGVEFGLPLAETAAAVRDRVRAALELHTELDVGRIDVVIDDIYPAWEAR